ncbi:hypothetical protein OG455_38085 [Kitasatospora sp. NBC_01287]|uniref:hypothetical protein n=1 Tax=Kitasatospora sp. NBC_01287 TaxID=2903573 RepID=UPI002258FB11|nr:hypothetical protein [Kitasatospora sp. NBC_01287]MCX4751248.1 hypothetical protein [Kitasatospora sp. NBC_01287]
MTPDFRLDGLDPADAHTAELHDRLGEGGFEAISQHDVGGERSFIVAFDTTATAATPRAARPAVSSTAKPIAPQQSTGRSL